MGWGVVALVALQTGGTGCTSPQSGTVSAHWCQSDVQIDTMDDMEDGDGRLCQPEGQWAALHGPAVVTTPDSGPVVPQAILGSLDLPLERRASSRALHFSGTGFDTNDAAHTAILRAAFSKVHSLVGYRQMTFWAKATMPIKMRVNVATLATTDVASGGTCQPGDAAPCGDSYGSVQDISTLWTEAAVDLSALRQEGFGQPVTDASGAVVANPDLAAATSVDFKYAVAFIDAEKFNNRDSFDLWIDDVQLVR